ncbi:hypothetical protein Krac_10183 [Ktedonobacter racemifer DSM 44963]|uniref:Uncharacterized protein n=1 Tax=Ktedonobacter racemifer DSM 44963 TaxID=485913 RepID=D6TFL5_KTERA|nr:hypothetical protein Krac_10183 [Ktedonobacter racemifer DSM 44963]
MRKLPLVQYLHLRKIDEVIFVQYWLFVEITLLKGIQSSFRFYASISFSAFMHKL